MSSSARSPRKNRVAASATSLRLFESFSASLGNDALKGDKLVRERRMAIAELIDAWLETQDEAARTAFFGSIELAATAPKRKRITTHPLRPAAVEAIVTRALAERENEAKRTEEAGAEAKVAAVAGGVPPKAKVG